METVSDGLTRRDTGFDALKRRVHVPDWLFAPRFLLSSLQSPSSISILRSNTDISR